MPFLSSFSPNPLASKLSLFATLSIHDHAALDQLVSFRTRSYDGRTDLIYEGATPDAMYVVLSGWACRFRCLPDGRRQILGFLLPGDTSDFDFVDCHRTSCSVASLTRLDVAVAGREQLQRIAEESPLVALAFSRSDFISRSIEREWIMNLGQRSASERVGHLLCELFTRLKSIGLSYENSCELPITQNELSEALGLSVVHTNRILQELRFAELISLKGKHLSIIDCELLRRKSLFSPDYLFIRGQAPRF